MMSACSTGTAAPPDAAPSQPPAKYKSVLIDGMPHVEQRPDFCGEACAEMVLRKLGKTMDQDFVFDQAGLSPELGRGCYTGELAPALYRMGFRVGRTWYQVASNNAAQELDDQFAIVHADLLKGFSSILCMHYDDQPESTEHFRLIVGYDAETDEVIYHEPAVADGGYQRMTRERLMKLWPLKYDSRRWTIIRMKMEPGQLIEGTAAKHFTNADYAQHILELKETIPSKDFHVVLQKPFVVVGDEAPATVKSRAVSTVKWAVDHIKKDFFAKDPEDIIAIWLFKDKESYEKHAKELFDDQPDTPYGYYSPRHKALVMNIATGGGTLVHEIVHPFIRSNFPDCPSWFNEGLASLYEQCSDRNGHIWGATNWRLRGLQAAIEDDSVPSFETLCGTTTREFYDDDPGTNYSQARYLCYYLQEQGLLIKYFNEFRKNVQDDPTGYDTLTAVLGEEDMDAFKKKWEEFVKRLRF